MSFFNSFPTVPYNFFNNKATEIVDIFRSAVTVNRGIDSAVAYQIYTIENQRPDQLAEEIYGNVNYYWTFFIVNKHLSEGWPLSSVSFEQYIDGKYDGFAMLLYRTNVNYALISGAEIAGDEPEYNSIAGKFEIGTILTGIGRDGFLTGDGFVDAIPASSVEAVVVGRNPNTNVLYLRYLLPDTEFTANEEFSGKAPNNNTYNIFDKYIFVPWREAPAYFVDIDNKRVDNITNLDTVGSYTTLYDEELEINDERRDIKVIRQEYIEDFIIAYRKSINGK
jgi:hypothetical protein